MSSTRSGDHCTLSLRLEDPSVEVTFEVGISLCRRVVSMVLHTNMARERGSEISSSVSTHKVLV
jgi:hypothetical protein